MSPVNERDAVVECVAAAERPLTLAEVKAVLRRAHSTARASTGMLLRLARTARLEQVDDQRWQAVDGQDVVGRLHSEGRLTSLSRAVDAALRRSPNRKMGWKGAEPGDLRRWWRRATWTADLDALSELQDAHARWGNDAEIPWAAVLGTPWPASVADSLPDEIVDTVADSDLMEVLAGTRRTFDPSFWRWLDQKRSPSVRQAAVGALRSLLAGDLAATENWLGRARVVGELAEVRGLWHLICDASKRGIVDLAQPTMPVVATLAGLVHRPSPHALECAEPWLLAVHGEAPSPPSVLSPPPHPVSLLVASVAAHWLQQPAVDCSSAAARARFLGLTWLAQELDGQEFVGASPLRLLREPTSAWARTLDALSHAAGASTAHVRIIWRVTLGPDAAVECVPRLQKRTARGTFTAGSRVVVADIAAGRVEGADERDQAIAASQHTVDEFTRRFDPATCWPALVGHPRLFDGRVPTRTLDVRAVVPRLRVGEEHDGSVWVRPEPAPAIGTHVHVREVNAGVVEVAEFTAAQASIARILGAGLHVPASGREAVARTLQHLVPQFTVLDATGLAAGPEATRVQPDSRPVVRLVPFEAGLAATVGVRPLGSRGPMPLPGHGPRTVTARTRQGSVWCMRELEREDVLHQAMVGQIPMLAMAAPEVPVELHTLTMALEVLESLQHLKEGVRVEWPEGKPLELLLADNDAFDVHLSEGSGIDWLATSATLKVGDLDADLARLLELIGTSNGRFIRLDQRRFLVLTEKVRQQIGLLAKLVQSSPAGMEIHAGAAHLLDGLVPPDDPALAAALHRSKLGPVGPPTELHATLRPYQLEGFRWLARLAHLGLGAILADDMGLGKTVQTLALLLSFRERGPALVIGPTSVEGNWVAEACRFAPSLRVRRLRDGDRHALLESLRSGDLVVGTYGLLKSMHTELSRIQWGTVVLDEAQNIKNADTQVHAAACELQARHRVALTGTPIENHLDELWAQFQFLQPGLLGERAVFRRRFSEPILRHAVEPTLILRRLLKPYILRRTKGEVLRDLPPRTNIDLRVDLSEAERAIYSELRQRAEVELEDAGQDRLPKLLRWLTKLKQAACHPGLIDARFAALESAKERAFSRTVDELRASGHRTLVFSQYVTHLKLLEARLVRDGVPYLYLDGSTPSRVREERVRQFQTGAATVFLISLKAGGSGLNLTGADHVIHMDPWWNPAVEDQASDRAHRIGQTRPVTVLRMVAADTIDEHILKLHHDKRHLAAEVLEGAAAAGRLSENELWSLIRGS